MKVKFLKDATLKCTNGKTKKFAKRKNYTILRYEAFEDGYDLTFANDCVIINVAKDTVTLLAGEVGNTSAPVNQNCCGDIVASIVTDVSLIDVSLIGEEDTIENIIVDSYEPPKKKNRKRWASTKSRNTKRPMDD